MGKGEDQMIYVTQFLPRAPNQIRPYKYRYQFRIPDSTEYTLSQTEFVCLIPSLPSSSFDRQ